MPVIDLYSKRRKRELGLEPDVYTYDDFTSSLRAQICYVITDVLSIQDQKQKERNCGTICEVLRREYGVYKLATGLHARALALDELLQFLSYERDVDRVLDAVELSFVIAETYREEAYIYMATPRRIQVHTLTSVSQR